MDALEALHTRSSNPKLSDPMPDPQTLENIYKAAFRAADHAVLRPWRFLLISGEARERLGDLFAETALMADPAVSEEKLQSVRLKPLRAPLIIVTICSPQPHPKVPEIEQELSAAAATQNMLLAAYAQNVGAIWRTGSMAYAKHVRQGLGLATHEKITAFLYLGTVTGAVKHLNDPPVDDYFRTWQA